MMKTHIDKEKALPVWAAIGVPFVGVPLLVALLALATPANNSAVTQGVEAPVAPTEVEAHVVVKQLDQGCETAELSES